MSGRQLLQQFVVVVLLQVLSACEHNKKLTAELMCLTIQVRGRHELVGVLMGSGYISGQPSVYARVSDKLGWIKKHTKGIVDSKCNVLS